MVPVAEDANKETGRGAGVDVPKAPARESEAAARNRERGLPWNASATTIFNWEQARCAKAKRAKQLDEGGYLVAAATSGHHEVVAMLLAAGADPNEVYMNENHWPLTPFFAATLRRLPGQWRDGTCPAINAGIDAGYDAVVQLLLAPGVGTDPNVSVERCTSSRTPLIEAVCSGRVGVVAQLLVPGVGTDPNKTEECMQDGRLLNGTNGTAPLCYAVETGVDGPTGGAGPPREAGVAASNSASAAPNTTALEARP